MDPLKGSEAIGRGTAEEIRNKGESWKKAGTVHQSPRNPQKGSSVKVGTDHGP